MGLQTINQVGFLEHSACSLRSNGMDLMDTMDNMDSFMVELWIKWTLWTLKHRGTINCHPSNPSVERSSRARSVKLIRG